MKPLVYLYKRLDDRDPMRISSYVMFLTLGLMYVSGGAHAGTMEKLVGNTTVQAWYWTLLLSCLVATVGSVMTPRYPGWGYVIEAIGVTIFSLCVLWYVLTLALGHTDPWATMLVFGGLSVGGLFRAGQCIYRRGLLVQAYIEAIQKMQERDAHGGT